LDGVQKAEPSCSTDFSDLPRQVLTEARYRVQPLQAIWPPDNLRHVVGQTRDRARSLLVGANAERIGALKRKQFGQAAEA
jgi:hypothetical protein